MDTIRSLASELELEASVLRKRMRRAELGFKIDDPLPEGLAQWIRDGKPIAEFKVPSHNGKHPGGETNIPGKAKSPRANNEKAKKRKPFNWRRFLSQASLPMLALPASYGVYYFASHVIPEGFAIAEAAAFELTYIGMALAKGKNPDKKKRFDRVAIGAVVVSIVYNTITAAAHLDPELLKNPDFITLWILSILHGFPLAILGYQVSNLLYHEN